MLESRPWPLFGSRSARTGVRGYAAALAAVIAVVAIEAALAPLIGPGELLALFLGAVLLGSWYGGLGPGLAVTALGAALAAGALPVAVVPQSAVASTGLAIFVVQGIALSGLGALLRAGGQRRRRTDAVLGGQRHALEQIVRGAPLRDVLEALARVVDAESRGAAVAGILLLDDEGRLCHGAAPGLPTAYNDAVDGIAIAPDLGTCAAAAARAEVVVTPDIARAPSWATLRDLPLGIGLRAAWSMPIRASDGRVLGTFGTYFRTPRHPTAWEREMVGMLAHTAAIAIERERAEAERTNALAEAERQLGDVTALVAANRELARSLELPPLLATLCRLARETVGAEGASFVLRQGERVQYVAEDAVGPLWSGQDFPITACISGWAMLERETAVVEDIYADARIPIDAYRPTFVRSLAMAPVRRADPLAALGVYWDRPHRATARETALLEALADAASIAVVNARLFDAMRAARVAAEEQSRAKDEFLAMLGHELRNPLAPIQNAVQVMQRLGTLEPRLATAREIIGRQVVHMTRLLDDLLDVSRITRGKISLAKTPTDVARVVAQALETARPLLAQRGHEVRVRVPEGLWVEGDEARLVQVVSNLLANAAKFTPDPGRVEVEASGPDGEVVLVVRDSGVGIAPDALERIFELFAQEEVTLDRQQGGLGIGLTLVRRLVEMHGGRVDAKSAGRGCGTELVVRLPRVTPAAVAAGDGSPRGVAEPLRVLVVDDNRDSAESLSLLLELLGHRVRVAGDGPAALALAAEGPIEVALVDIGLPGMDGYEVARRLRPAGNGGPSLLVALTGYGRAEDRRRALDAGFDHHLVKPADPEALQDLLARVSPPTRHVA